MRNLTWTNKSNHTAEQWANKRHIFFHHHKCLWLHRLSQDINFPELQTLTGKSDSHITIGNIIEDSSCFEWGQAATQTSCFMFTLLCKPYWPTQSSRKIHFLLLPPLSVFSFAFNQMQVSGPFTTQVGLYRILLLRVMPIWAPTFLQTNRERARPVLEDNTMS